MSENKTDSFFCRKNMKKNVVKVWTEEKSIYICTRNEDLRQSKQIRNNAEKFS